MKTIVTISKEVEWAEDVWENYPKQEAKAEIIEIIQEDIVDFIDGAEWKVRRVK